MQLGGLRHQGSESPLPDEGVTQKKSNLERPDVEMPSFNMSSLTEPA